MSETGSNASELTVTSQFSNFPQRRPRVREVSSRFLTPAAPRSFSASSLSPATRTKPRSISVERQRSIGGADENKNDSNRASVSPPRIARAVAKLTFTHGDRVDTPIPLKPDPKSTSFEKTPNFRTSGVAIHSRYLKERPRKILNSTSSSLDLQTPIREVSSVFHSLKPSDCESLKEAPVGLPPVPTAKQRKSQTLLENTHSLKLHHNRLLQWRFINAKAEVSSQAQQTESEKQLLTQITKNSELLQSVTKKRMEFARLRSCYALERILETQTPLLDDWSSTEREYTSNLSEAIQAFLNCSSRVPLGENCVADVAELRQCFGSAANLMESISSRIIKFICNSQQADVSMSELATLVVEEKALIDQSGELLSEMSMSSVAEISLRSHLIQMMDNCVGSDRTFRQDRVLSSDSRCSPVVNSFCKGCGC